MRRASVLVLLVAAANAGAAAIRIVNDNNTWWFEDGAGRRFFSLGVCCVAGCWGHAEDKPMDDPARRKVVGRLKGWGFNTAAAWSRPSVWSDVYVADEIYPGFEYGANDPFDEAFWAGWFPQAVEREAADFKGRANVIGYFVDNEPKWDADGIWAKTMTMKKTSPARRALAAFLAARGGEPTPAVKRAWRTEAARAYYGRYVALLRKADPEHLVLGVRWSGLPDTDLYDALSPLFDVNSVNDYNRYGTLRPAYAERYAATGKPVMITEWSFSGYPEPGHKSLQFIDVYTQARRAEGYRKYVLEAARAPFMVGMHWFLWSDYERRDEADGGYPPDENMGLVTADGATAYEELVRECARTNAEVEAVHRSAAWTKPAERPPEERALVRFTPRLDGDLAEWPAGCTATPWVSESLEAAGEPGHRYLLAADDAFLYVGADIPDAHPDDPGREWMWEGDYLALYAHPEGGDDAAVYLAPKGGGKDRRDALVWWWKDAPVSRDAAAVRRDRPGGFTLEARLPWRMLGGDAARRGPLRVELNYRDVSGIYETWWSGRVRVR